MIYSYLSEFTGFVLEIFQACHEMVIPAVCYVSSAMNGFNRDHHVIIQVGIDPEILDEIFVPFYTTKPQGSGIGLSLARQVMRMHGGNIRITSGKGEGTTVYLDFQG